MSFWNNVLLKKISSGNNNYLFRIKIETDICRIYFFIKKSSNFNSFSVKIIIFLN